MTVSIVRQYCVWQAMSTVSRLLLLVKMHRQWWWLWTQENQRIANAEKNTRKYWKKNLKNLSLNNLSAVTPISGINYWVNLEILPKTWTCPMLLWCLPQAGITVYIFVAEDLIHSTLLLSSFLWIGWHFHENKYEALQ